MENKVPITLDDFGLKSIKIDWFNPIDEGAGLKTETTIGYDMQQQAEGDKLRVSMTFKDTREQTDGKKLFAVEGVVLGFFSFPEGKELKERVRLVYTLGLPMLISSLRGLLLSLSGVFPPDFRYVLPTIDVREMVQVVEAGRKAKKPANSLVKKGRTSQKKGHGVAEPASRKKRS